MGRSVIGGHLERLCMKWKIVNSRNHLKFLEEAKLSAKAEDLISKLLCNVEQRQRERFEGIFVLNE